MSRGRIIADGSVTALCEQLGHDAEVTWIQDGERHVHTTAAPEYFLNDIDDTIDQWYPRNHEQGTANEYI